MLVKYNFNGSTEHFKLFIILYQQMHFNISYNVRILYGTLLHVSAQWYHPQGTLRSLLKLHTIIILQNMMLKID